MIKLNTPRLVSMAFVAALALPLTSTGVAQAAPPEPLDTSGSSTFQVTETAKDDIWAAQALDGQDDARTKKLQSMAKLEDARKVSQDAIKRADASQKAAQKRGAQLKKAEQKATSNVAEAQQRYELIQAEADRDAEAAGRLKPLRETAAKSTGFSVVSAFVDTTASASIEQLHEQQALAAQQKKVLATHENRVKELRADLRTNQSDARRAQATRQLHEKTIETLNKNLAIHRNSLPEKVTLDAVHKLKTTVPAFESAKDVEAYEAALATAGVHIVSAAAMKDPQYWPASYLPLKTEEGSWQVGAAQVELTPGKSVVVLPREILDAMKTGFNQVGIPYLWGGTTTAGFDCSGLMQYMLRPEGMGIRRVAAQQQDDAPQVKKDNLLPGDMVFMGNYAHHVAMYVGNGKMLEAPRTGLNLRVTALRKHDTQNRPSLLVTPEKAVEVAARKANAALEATSND